MSEDLIDYLKEEFLTTRHSWEAADKIKHQLSQQKALLDEMSEAIQLAIGLINTGRARSNFSTSSWNLGKKAFLEKVKK